MTLEAKTALLIRAGRLCAVCGESRPESCKCDTPEAIARIVAEDKAQNWPRIAAQSRDPHITRS